MNGAEERTDLHADPVGDLSWLLDDLVTRVVHIQKAAVLSRDGLTMGASSGLTKEDADHLSAVAAGFQSLARGAGDAVVPREPLGDRAGQPAVAAGGLRWQPRHQQVDDRAAEHAQPPLQVVEAFGDLAEGTAACPPGCDHLSPGCALDEWAAEHDATARLESLRRLLRSRESAAD